MGRLRLSTIVVSAALACGTVGWSGSAAAAAPVGMAESFPTHCGVRELVSGPGGNVWFTCFAAAISGGRTSIGRITPAGEVSEFGGPVPANDEPGGIVLGPDGNLWFTLNTGINLLPREQHAPAIGRVTPSGEVTIYQTGLNPKYGLSRPLAGPDGNVWFTTGGSGRQRSIGRITPSGQITETPVDVGTDEGQVGELEVGPDGNLWFTKPAPGGGSSVLVRLTPGGEMTEFASGIPGFGPGEPVTGSDGNLWFLEYAKPEGVGRITPSGQISEFSAGFGNTIGAAGLISGPGGDLWFASKTPPQIGRVTTAGQIDEFSQCLRYGQPYFGPETLVAGPDGSVWFTSLASRQLPGISDPPSIGRITPAGAITQIYGGVDREPHWIAAGPDGRIWFSAGADEIQRIAPFASPVNTFHVLPLRQAAANGRARVRVIVAGPGKLVVRPLALLLPHHKTVALKGPPVTARATACGTPSVPVKPAGAAMKQFRKLRRATERVEVTFTPTGGTPYSEQRSLQFFGPRRGRHHG